MTRSQPECKAENVGGCSLKSTLPPRRRNTHAGGCSLNPTAPNSDSSNDRGELAHSTRKPSKLTASDRGAQGWLFAHSHYVSLCVCPASPCGEHLGWVLDGRSLNQVLVPCRNKKGHSRKRIAGAALSLSVQKFRNAFPFRGPNPVSAWTPENDPDGLFHFWVAIFKIGK